MDIILLDYLQAILSNVFRLCNCNLEPFLLGGGGGYLMGPWTSQRYYIYYTNIIISKIKQNMSNCELKSHSVVT